MLDSLNKLVEPVRILIVIGIATTLALTGWFLVVGPEQTTLRAVATTQSAAGGLEPVGVEAIAELNLFGDASNAVAATAAQAGEDLETTQLNLDLVGIFAAFDDDEGQEVSVALIAEKNRPAKDYRVNDRLPGGATLVEIHADRVILTRAGKREQLPFHDPSKLISASEREVEPDDFDEPDISDTDDSQLLSDVEQLDADDEGSMRRVIATFEEQLTNDPEGTLSGMGVEPVAQNEARGYKLGALAAHPALRQTGLQAGDVLLSVNNRAVGDVSRDRLEIASVMAQGSARLEVQRGTRRFFVTVSLK